MDNTNSNKKNTEELYLSILALLLSVMIVCNTVITTLIFDRVIKLEEKLNDGTYEEPIETIETKAETIVESDVITNEAVDILETVVETEPAETVAETKIIETVAERQSSSLPLPDPTAHLDRNAKTRVPRKECT